MIMRVMMWTMRMGANVDCELRIAD
jgi:hypothetical protein